MATDVTRTFVRKLQYVAIVAVGLVVTYGLLLWYQAPSWVWVATAVVLLVPGRIAGHYYRDLFTGRRLMDSRRVAEAVPFFERFLERVRGRPWLRRLIWLSAGIYTVDVEAMALNNLGASYLELGDLDRVEAPLRQALAIDPDYPVPYVNLALLAEARGDLEAAAVASTVAKRLGHNDTRIDRLIRDAASTLAVVEGRSKV
jgi:tetratricopeptide (TPR) repeat protein